MIDIFCALLHEVSELFLILVVVGKVQIAKCNRELGNMEMCIEQLKEIRKVEEPYMPDSRSRLCTGQYSSVSVFLFYGISLTFYYFMQ